MTQTKYILVEPKLLKGALEAAEECDIPQSNIFLLDIHGEEAPPGYQSWKTLLEHGERDWVSDLNAGETTAAYVSTSGTSGLPKAAILTHSYMVSQSEVIGRVTGGSHEVSQLICQREVATLMQTDAIPYRHTTFSRVHHASPAWCSLKTGYTMLHHVTVRGS